jgi:hypothetical protein
MLENKKYWNNPSIYEYNIMHYTVFCWLLGEHGDRECVSNGGERVDLIKTDLKTKSNPPWKSVYT